MKAQVSPTETAEVGPYSLPPLAFDYGALEPVIDTETMRLHHDKHHRAYVDHLNEALAKHPQWLGLTIEDLLKQLSDLPADIRQAVREQGGGHANHQFFWKTLTPKGTDGPTGDLLQSINKSFGSFEQFKTRFEAAGLSHFGSGWAFLVCRPGRDFGLEILTLSNQDSVLSFSDPAPGLLACDLWEHAYYLKYNNRRAEWLKAWWGIVDWHYVGTRLAKIREGRDVL
jgi:superoxide dismutase, Fe-Mn family